MDNAPRNLSPADSDDVKRLLGRKRGSKVPVPVSVRLMADICLLLSTCATVVFLVMMDSHLSIMPFIIGMSVMIILLFGYRKAKKWALLFIGGLYMINLGMWVFSIYQGAPPELGKQALPSVIWIALLSVGALNWKHFS